jgi:WD40 repeat protein
VFTMRNDRLAWLLIATALAFLAHIFPVAAQPVPGKPKKVAAPSAGDQGSRPADPSEYASKPEIYPFLPAMFASASLSSNGNWMAGGTSDWTKPGDMLLWDVAKRELKFQQHFEQGVSTVTFSPDGTWLAAGSFTGELVLVDVARAKLVARWKPHTESVQGMVFSADGKLLASPSIDKSVKVWDVVPPADTKAGLPLQLMFDAHTDEVLTAAFASDGKTLYTGCRDQKVFVWDLQKPRNRRARRPARSCRAHHECRFYAGWRVGLFQLDRRDGAPMGGSQRIARARARCPEG